MPLTSGDPHFRNWGFSRRKRLNPQSTGKQPTPLSPSPFAACGLSSPPRPPGSVSAGGGEVQGGSCTWGWGWRINLEGLRYLKT